MNTKHTPGPWKIQNLSNGDIYVNAWIDTDVCKVYRPYPMAGESGDPDFQTARMESNARLIAAAPELLEALQGIVTNEHKCSCEEAGEECNGECWHAIALRAIAKATGEPQ